MHQNEEGADDTGDDMKGEPAAHRAGPMQQAGAFAQAVERLRHNHQQRADDAQPVSEGMAAARHRQQIIRHVDGAKHRHGEESDFQLQVLAG